MPEVYFSSRSIVYLSRLTHMSVYCICKCVCMEAEGQADCLPVDALGVVGKCGETEGVKTKEEVVFAVI